MNYAQMINVLDRVHVTNVTKENLTIKQRALYCINDKAPTPANLIMEYEFWKTFIIEFARAQDCEKFMELIYTDVKIMSKLSSTRVMVQVSDSSNPNNKSMKLYYKPNTQVIEREPKPEKFKWYYLMDQDDVLDLTNIVTQLYTLPGCVLVLAIVEFFPNLKTMHIACVSDLV